MGFSIFQELETLLILCRVWIRCVPIALCHEKYVLEDVVHE